MHKYICEKCKKHKGCNITGCKGECAKLCGLCITKDRLEKWEGKGL